MSRLTAISMRNLSLVAEWLKLVWGPIGLILIAAFDPLGIESASSDASLKAFQRIYAPFYSSQYQDDILVVSIRDEDLPLSPDAASDWPPSYDDYARIIDVVLGQESARPEAVFIDLILDREPTEANPVEPLCEQIARASSVGVTLIFAAHPDHGMPHGIAQCHVKPEISSATWIADEASYGLSYTIEDHNYLTIAADLFRRSIAPSDVTQFNRFVESETDMVVMWGAEPPVFDDQCDPPSTGQIPLIQSLDLFFSGMTLDPERRRRYEQQQKCLYHASLGVSQLLAAQSPPQRRLAARFVKDKYVMVGAELSDQLDRHPSPVHGSAPGVYVHAMALDNLLTYGERFIRRAPHWTVPFIGAQIGLDDTVQALVLFFLIGAMAVFTRALPFSTRMERFLSGVNARVVAITFLAVMVTIAVSVTFFWLRWTPLNWGGVLITGLIVVIPWNFIRKGTNIETQDASPEGEHEL